MAKTRIWGLDISTKTGSAFIDIDDDGSVELVDQRLIEFPKATGFTRLSYFGQAVLDLLEEYQPDMVMLEGYGYNNKHTLATLVEVGTVIRYFLFQCEVDYIEVAPNALKQFLTGKGNAQKDKMMMEVMKRWGHEPLDNNTADAIALAYFGGALLDKVEMPAQHIKALDKVRAGKDNTQWLAFKMARHQAQRDAENAPDLVD